MTIICGQCGSDVAVELIALSEIDVDGVIGKDGVRYIGCAHRQPDGTWRCLANVGGALCVVEISITLKEPA